MGPGGTGLVADLWGCSILALSVSSAIVPWPLALAQQVANAACLDPEERANAQFDLGNGVWIVIGIAFWVVLAGQAWLRLGGEPFWLLWVGR